MTVNNGRGLGHEIVQADGMEVIRTDKVLEAEVVKDIEAVTPIKGKKVDKRQKLWDELDEMEIPYKKNMSAKKLRELLVTPEVA